MNIEDYETNLAEAVRAEGGTAIMNTEGRIDAVRTANGATVAWRPPEGTTTDSPELHAAAVAIRAMTNAAAQAAAVERDADLSDTAKARKVADVWTVARGKVDRALHDVETDMATFEAACAAFYAPPPVADAVEQVRDMEARQWLAAQPEAALPGIAQKMTAGELPALLAAAMRSPVPLPGGIAQVLPAAWRAHLERTAPDRLHAMEAIRERKEWARMVTRQVGSVVAPAA